MLASHGALRPGLTEQEPADLAAALTRPEIYLILSGGADFEALGLITTPVAGHASHLPSAASASISRAIAGSRRSLSR